MAPSEFTHRLSNLDQARGARVQRLANEFMGGVGVSISTAFVNGVGEAVGKRVPEIGNAVAAAISRNLQATSRLETNMILAKGAQDAVLAAYEGRTRYYTGDDGRTIGRYGPGVLAKALGETEMVAKTTRDRIVFYDTGVLDAQAPHWRRLNFGAGGNATNGGEQGVAPGRFDLNFYGPRGGAVPVGRLSLDPQVQPAMQVVAFRYKDGVFHVKKNFRDLPRVTLGARGAQFLDAGLEYIGKNAGREYAIWLRKVRDNPRTIKAIEAELGRPIHPSAYADPRSLR